MTDVQIAADTVGTLSLVLASSGLLAVIGTLAMMLRWRHRSASVAHLANSMDPMAAALLDSRSCYQTALNMVRVALVGRLAVEPDLDACRRAVRLMLESPSVCFSEVLDERRLLAIERSTAASTVWIVSPDQVIEFEYAESVSFSSAVLANLRRGIRYHYLVRDTKATRARAVEVAKFLEDLDLGESLEIRFRGDEYWNTLGERTEELVLFESADGARLYYRFPAFGAVSGRWVAAPAEDAPLWLADLKAVWSIAAMRPIRST